MKQSSIERQSLKDQIRKILFDQIVSGERSPGERLKIIPIAESLGVSQAPVREAIHCLATGGYLEHLPNVGFRVREFSKSDLRDIYQIREALEMSALKQPMLDCQNLSKQLEAYFVKMKASAQNNSYKNYAHYDTLFHRCLVESTRNQRMIEIWESLLVPKHITPVLKELKISIERAVQLHVPIIENLKKRRAMKASEYLARHYDKIRL